MIGKTVNHSESDSDFIKGRKKPREKEGRKWIVTRGAIVSGE